MAKICNIIFFIIVIFNFSFQYIVLNFKTNIDLNQLNEENYMNTSLAQQLNVDFNIGDSHQIIPMTIKTQQFPTYIVSSRVTDKIKVKYNETKSCKSFHNIKDDLIKELYIYDFKEGYLVNDSITFNSSLIYNNFTYMLATKVSILAKNISGEIGLSKEREEKYPYNFPEKTDFLQQLKDNKLIQNKIFGIVYDTEYEGRLFLGAYLHQTDHLYSEEDLQSNYIDNHIPHDFNNKWLINFNVKCLEYPDNKELYIEENTFGLVMYEIGLIVGSETFRQNFLIDYFNKNKCNESMIHSKPFSFYQYSCDNEQQFSGFPDIILTLPGKYIFNFTKKELFKKIGKKYIFQIVFEVTESDRDYWRLGQTFFRKYNSFFTLEEGSSTFSYYQLKKNIRNEETTWILSAQIILIIALILILLLFISILVYFCFYCEKKKRKRIAQELVESEDYYYTPENNEKENKKSLIVND